ncbi:hypothetical protein ACVGWY_26005, partial [Enterobacter intestinihominis]
ARHPCGHFCFTTWPIFMFIKVLGSGGPGGFTQCKCKFSNCHRLRNGTLKATPRTHSSIIVSDKGEQWIMLYLINIKHPTRLMAKWRIPK